MEDRWCVPECEKVAPKVMIAIYPELENGVSVKNHVLSFAPGHGKASASPRLILNGRPSIDDFEKVPVDIRMGDAQGSIGSLGGRENAGCLCDIPFGCSIRRQRTPELGVWIIFKRPESTHILERVSSPSSFCQIVSMATSAVPAYTSVCMTARRGNLNRLSCLLFRPETAPRFAMKCQRTATLMHSLDDFVAGALRGHGDQRGRKRLTAQGDMT